MGLVQTKPVYTEQEYLAFEREAEERHEYLDGWVYAMAGESSAHADICVNLTILLGSQLRGKQCRARVKDTKIRSGPFPIRPRGTKGLYSYPDIVVICGEPKHLDEHRDVITNPQVVVEVLSESTQNFDRTEKFRRYRQWNPTLTDYVLVAQDKPWLEHYALRPDGEWVYQAYFSLEQTAVIKSIGCSLPLRDVYDRIVFPALAPETEADRPGKGTRKKAPGKPRKKS